MMPPVTRKPSSMSAGPMRTWSATAPMPLELHPPRDQRRRMSERASARSLPQAEGRRASVDGGGLHEAVPAHDPPADTVVLEVVQRRQGHCRVEGVIHGG